VVPVFSYSSRGWVIQEETKEPAVLEDAFSVLTWNVWFDPYRRKRRWPALASIMHKCSPTFICLQEVTPEFLGFLLEQDWVRTDYVASDRTGETVSPYGVLILAKVPIVQFELFRFPRSGMFRGLLSCRFAVKRRGSAAPQSVVLGTSHLESLDPNTDHRIGQLKTVFEILAPAQNAIFVGDMNFGATAKYLENAFVPLTYLDAWKDLEKDDPGFTMPESHPFPAWRPDRIFVKKGDVRASSISRIGTEVLLKCESESDQDYREDMPKTPSDHYGLFAQFQIG